MSARKPCILISVHAAHQPLIDALQAEGRYRVMLFGGPEFQGYCDAAQPRNEALADARVAAWLEAMRSLAATRPFYLSGQDMSVPLLERLLPVILPGAHWFHVMTDALEQLHRENPIRVVIVHNDCSHPMRMLIAWAKQRGVPSLHLPHGMNIASSALKDFAHLIYTDTVGVHGEYEEDWFLENPGNRPEQIERVGRPEWDAYYTRAGGDREGACRALGLDPAREVLGYAGTWAYDLSTFDVAQRLRDAFRDFLSGVKALGGEAPQLLIRPHPAHRGLGDYGPEWHERIAAEVGVALHIPDASLEDFLAASDLVVALESSTLLHALLAHRRALSIALPQPGSDAPSGYERLEGVDTCALEPSAIAAALRAGLRDEAHKARLDAAREETLKFVNHRHDGQATRRALALIEALANRATTEGDIDDERNENPSEVPVNRALAAMVPVDARRILIVGCGPGHLGAWLKRQAPGREVVGIEPEATAAREARQHLDVVHEGEIEGLALPYPQGHFDCIVYDGALEKLQAPAATMAAHRRLLAPKGEVLACLAHLAHWTVIEALLSGRPAGQGEEDGRPRAFTAGGFEALLARAGLRPTSLQTLDHPDQRRVASLRLLATAWGIDHPQLEAQASAASLLYRACHAAEPERPAVLPDARGHNIVMFPASAEHVTHCLESFLGAFTAQDDVALHILAGEALDQVQALVLEWLDARGIDAGRIPLVSLLGPTGDESQLLQALTQADMVLGDAEVLAIAHQHGIPGSFLPAAADLRAAGQALPGSALAPSPLPLDGPKEVVFLHHPDWSTEAWQAVVSSYVQAFSPEDEVTLALWLDPGQGVDVAAVDAALAPLLARAGVEPARLPDLLLVPDALEGAGVDALFVAASCVVPHGDAAQDERATRLGLPVLESIALDAWRDAAKTLSAMKREQGPALR